MCICLDHLDPDESSCMTLISSTFQLYITIIIIIIINIIIVYGLKTKTKTKNMANIDMDVIWSLIANLRFKQKIQREHIYIIFFLWHPNVSIEWMNEWKKTIKIIEIGYNFFFIGFTLLSYRITWTTSKQ